MSQYLHIAYVFDVSIRSLCFYFIVGFSMSFNIYNLIFCQTKLLPSCWRSNLSGGPEMGIPHQIILLLLILPLCSQRRRFGGKRARQGVQGPKPTYMAIRCGVYIPTNTCQFGQARKRVRESFGERDVDSTVVFFLNLVLCMT